MGRYVEFESRIERIRYEGGMVPCQSCGMSDVGLDRCVTAVTRFNHETAYLCPWCRELAALNAHLAEQRWRLPTVRLAQLPASTVVVILLSGIGAALVVLWVVLTVLAST